jgi:hypothetical protein
LIIQKATNFCNDGINIVERKIYKQNLKIIRLKILPERQFNFESILQFDLNRNRKQSNGTLLNQSLPFLYTQQVKMAPTGRAKKRLMFKNTNKGGGG